ncbi:CheR family methyltransferase [Flavobacterium hungaricum]|uniref:protein-glutamate O-methyltransferase n=1 Tax=Flavobacterium hungaricum TaxID=2082725 RepID=A0ABR9TLX3_9FLAO|nr:CheR family methyltransferase [Flavobacterium hungaricum]MBE8726350.1 hypothetical protein [Flavobacterium hungaricum]
METIVQDTGQNKPFLPVVGIAAGTGGMDAITKLIAGIAANSSMAFVIIYLHTTEYPEDLSEVIKKDTNLAVTEIITTLIPAPGHIYTVPKNSDLTVQDGILTVHKRTRLDKPDGRFDLFFTSLAQIYKGAAVGIILSGTGFDGMEGLKGLKELGAAAVVQDPRTAAFRELPQSIINAGMNDYIETPEHIAELLKKIVLSIEETDAYEESGYFAPAHQELISKIKDLLLFNTGTDFNAYKQYYVRRRIAHRMVIARRETLHDYYVYLRYSKEEQDLLFNDLLITVSGFFRDNSFYDSLTAAVFPQLIRNTVNNSLRIWIAGCATGQEAYSVAIALHEYLIQTDNPDIQVQIFASDLSAAGISKAREGLYKNYDLDKVSANRLHNYFTKRIDGYHVQDEIRNMCIFAVHNLVKDPPLGDIDLVCCSNVLNFFNGHNENAALEAFHYALREKGILVTGISENSLKTQNLFANSGQPENLYIRNTILQERDESSALMSTVSDDKNISSYNGPLMARESPKQQYSECAYTDSGALAKNIKQQLLTGCKELEKKNKLEASLAKSIEAKNNELKLLHDELRNRQKLLSAASNFAEGIIQTNHEPVALIDKNFIITNANAAFYRYFKTAQNKTEGYSFFEIGNCQWDTCQLKDHILKLQRGTAVLENFRVETECEGIGKKIMNVSARPLHDGKPDSPLIVSLKDITEINSLYELFENKNLEIQQYNDLMKTFSGAASSNMLDPLQKIQMLSRRIFDTEIHLSETSRHHLQRILFSAENMCKLIEDLILYSKISFLTKEYKRTDLNLIIKKNLNDLKTIIKQKRAVVKVAPLPALEVMPKQIQQLFTNIISNAIQYSKDDVIPEIHIDIKQPSTEEIIDIGGNPELSFAKISVTDNGIGFDNRYEKQIFDPFFRLHNNDQYVGSGLGLTVVKKIVSSHRGYIRASSKIHEGTKIYIYIPTQQLTEKNL